MYVSLIVSKMYLSLESELLNNSLAWKVKGYFGQSLTNKVKASNHKIADTSKTVIRPINPIL